MACKQRRLPLLFAAAVVSAQFFAKHSRKHMIFRRVRSAHLRYAAQQCGAQARAYFARLSFQLQLEADAAARLSKREGGAGNA